jgi:hypothetical protein
MLHLEKMTTNDLFVMLEKVLAIAQSSLTQVEELKKEVHAQRRLIKDLQGHLQENTKQLKMVGNVMEMNGDSSKVQEVMEDIDAKLKTYVESAKQENKHFLETKQQELDMEEKERRDQEARLANCKLSGLSEESKENTTTLVCDFLKDQLRIHDPQVIQAFRIGQKKGDLPRPIIVKFVGAYEKARVIGNRAMLKGQRIWLDDDLTPTQWQARKVELEKVKKAQQEGWIAYLRGGQAIITHKKKDMLK